MVCFLPLFMLLKNFNYQVSHIEDNID